MQAAAKSDDVRKGDFRQERQGIKRGLKAKAVKPFSVDGTAVLGGTSTHRAREASPVELEV